VPVFAVAMLGMAIICLLVFRWLLTLMVIGVGVWTVAQRVRKTREAGWPAVVAGGETSKRASAPISGASGVGARRVRPCPR
jgi:hypothetical protein